MTVKELRELLDGLDDDVQIMRNDSEWGPQEVDELRRVWVCEIAGSLNGAYESEEEAREIMGDDVESFQAIVIR